MTLPQMAQWPMAKIMAQARQRYAKHIRIINSKNRLGLAEVLCPALCQMCHTNRMLETVVHSAREYPLARSELADTSEPLVLRRVYNGHAQRVKVDCPVDNIRDGLPLKRTRLNEAMSDGQRNEK